MEDDPSKDLKQFELKFGSNQSLTWNMFVWILMETIERVSRFIASEDRPIINVFIIIITIDIFTEITAFKSFLHEQKSFQSYPLISLQAFCKLIFCING